MRFKLISLLIILFITVSVQADVYKQIRVLTTDQSILQKLSEFEAVDYRPGQYIEIITDESGFDKLGSLGVAYEIVHDDLTAFYQSRYPLGTTMGGLRTYSEIIALLDTLANSWYWWHVKAGADQYRTEYSDTWSFLVDYDTSYAEFIAGYANSNGQVIGSDVTYLVGYFRSINPPPDPLLAGDTNEDCLVTGPDVTYLVNYFRGTGNPPFQGDCQVVINHKAGSAEDF